VSANFTQENLDHISAFDLANHPDFQSLARDPGKLEFNHQLHMSAGMDTKKKGDPNWSLEKIRLADRSRYRENDSGVIQLDCNSCHCLDSVDFRFPGNRLEGVPVSVLRARSPGDYFLPITYENQCRPCHVLTAKAIDDPHSPQITIPHRLQPGQVHDFLWGTVLNHYDEVKHKEQSQKELFDPQRREELAGEKPKNINVEEGISLILQQKVKNIERILYPEKQTCRECHRYDLQNNRTVPKTIEPPHVPEIWLQRALFNHTAHRALKCTQCHEMAETSDKSDDVLIPGIKTCVECHAPGKGARFDCTECHRYHDGAKSRRDDAGLFFGGFGSSLRGSENKMTIKEFMKRP
jgi:hypothetical protein